MSVQVYIKRTAPQGPGRGTITLTPGDWTSGGAWTATEDQHEGDPLFSAKNGTYTIQNRIATLLGTDLKPSVRLNDWAQGSISGPGMTFDPTDNSNINIAWRYGSPWPLE